MAFKITDVEAAEFLTKEVVATALGRFGISVDSIQNCLRRFVCDVPLTSEGYQKVLAKELESHIRKSFTQDGTLRWMGNTYCPRLNEKADVVLGSDNEDRRIYFEIEFRPNAEKDLVKFQIGFNSNRLAVAVLILASDRKSINPKYPTMPEFCKFARLIPELRPTYPLLLLGISGEHI